MNELQKLYDVLVRDGYYTKSFDEFTTQFQTPEYQDKVFNVVSRDGLFTKSKDEFLQKYTIQQPVEPVKKKEDTVSSLEAGSLESAKKTETFTQQYGKPLDGMEQFEYKVGQGLPKLEQQISEEPREVELETNPIISFGKRFWDTLSKQIPSAMEAKAVPTISTMQKNLISNVASISDVPDDEIIQMTDLTNPRKGKRSYKASEYRRLANEKIASFNKARAAALDLSLSLNKDMEDSDVISSLSQVNDGYDLLNFVTSSIGQTAAQIPLSVLTGGGMSYAMESGNIYLETVKEIAEKEGITPIQVIEQGKDQVALAEIGGALSGALDFIGAKKVLDAFGFDNMKKDLRRRALKILINSQVEGVTETGQEVISSAARGIGVSGEPKLPSLTQALDAYAAGMFGSAGIQLPSLIGRSKKDADAQQETEQAVEPVIEPVILQYGDSQFGFISDGDGNIEYTRELDSEDQANSVANMLANAYKKIQFSVQEIQSSDPYEPTKYKIIGTEIKEDAVQEQTTSEVPLQPEARVGEEVAQGEPQAEPQVVTQEEVVSSKTPEFSQEEVDALEAKLLEDAIDEDADPQFQLETTIDTEGKKTELVSSARKLMDSVSEQLEQQPSVVENPTVTPIPINVTENTELANKVPKMSLRELIGKKINLVMADQLKVGDGLMGGNFFPLIDKLFGKAAWASIDLTSARKIVKGAINGDYSVVYNMAPTAVDSNSAFMDTLIKRLQQSGSKETTLAELKDYVKGKKFGKKTDQVISMVESSATLDELADKMNSLDVDTMSNFVQKILPSKNVKAATQIGVLLQSQGITQESIREEISEQFARDLPMGAMTMVLKITDRDGNPVTENNIDDAIITQEQQDAEGLPKHKNYPIYIRGKAVAMLSETVPFWNMSKSALDTINAKIAGVIRGKEGGAYTSSQARAAEVRRASMKASSKFKATKPTKTQYQQFVERLSKAIPSVEVVTSQEAFNKLLSDLNAKKLATKNQKIYGAVLNGKLYLNPNLENFNTPIHEFGHIWTNTVKELSPEIYQKGIELITGSDYVAQIESNPEYKRITDQMKKNGATDQQIREYVLEEALATAIGDKGESFVTAAQQRSFKTWLNDLFQFVKNLTGISNMSAEQIQNLTLDDFLNGVVTDLLSENEIFKNAEVKNLSSQLQLMTGGTMSASRIIKTGRANGFSEQAIRTVLSNRGFSEAEIDAALAKETGAASRVEVTEEFAKGYDRVKGEIEGIIQKSLNRGRSEAEAMQNAIDYLQGTKMYENATDVQREKMVRDIRKSFGKREKSAPSPKKLFGEAKNVREITMSEYNLLKKQIRDTATGARNAMSAWKKASAELVKYLKDMVKGGHVTTKQSLIILKKFSGVNLFSDESVSNFVDYMARVFNNADYAEQISTVRSLLKNAKRNTKDKIGIANNLTPLLNRILAINPTMIPDSVFKKYYDLVNMMGQRKTVLELDEIGQVTQVANEILDGVNTELNQVDELALRFDSYDDKVIKDGKVDFAATVNQMLSDDIITEEEANLLKKYKSLIVESESRKKTDEEIAQEKKALVDSVNQAALNPNTLPTTDEKNLARTLADLIRTNAVEGLNNSQLKNLLKLIDNINNGYLPHYAELMVEKLNGIKDAKILDGSLSRAKPLPISKFYSNLKSILTNKDGMYEMIRRQPLYYIDQLFGDFKTKDIFNTVFKRAAEGESKFVKEYGDVRKRLDNALNKVSSSFKFNHNKTVESSYKMMTYLLQLEYISNPDSKKVHSAKDYLEKTIKTINKGNTRFGEADAKILQSILDEYVVDGKIDIDKLYDSFNDAELSAIETIQDINKSLESKAEYTAAIIRGNKITPLNNYVHHNVLLETTSDENIDSASSISNYNNSMSPSTKAKSLIERTDRVTPLNFDVFASANRGSRFVLMDYHLTSAIRTTRKTINEARKLSAGDKKKTQILNAIDKGFNEAVNNLLMNNMMSTSFVEDAADYISRQGYRAVLASVPRFAGELSSNLAFVAIASPKDFSTGVGLRGVAMSSDASNIMNNLGSKNTNRLYPHDTLVGRTVDSNILNQAHGISGGKSKNSVANKMQQIYNMTLKKPKNFAEATADILISTPDKLVMQPLWFGAFSNAFQSITGSKPDFNKIAENDEAYMTKFKDALSKSTETADKKSVLTGASDNAFMGILKGTSKPNQSGWVRAFNNFNSFMTRFLIYEYITARTGIYALVNGGTISRKNGAALLGAVTTRMVMYTLLTTLLSEAMVGMFVDREEEEDDKSFFQKVGQALTSSMTSLILGRDFGNATKSMISYGVEQINKEYLDFLREGEYDPYKDAIQYQTIPMTKEGRDFDVMDLILNLSGSYSPAAKTLEFAVRKFTEDPKKRADAMERSESEMQVRLPLEVLGNLGYVPLYKDVRKIVNAEIYKSLSNSQKKQPEEKKFKMSKEDMKTYYPELYQEMYGVGGYLYEKEMIDKQVEQEKKRVKKEMEMFK